MTGYRITESYEDLRKQVRAFAAEVVQPLVPIMERDREVRHDLAKAIARQGWTSATVGPEYEGLGLGHYAKTIILEELARENGAAAAIAQAGIIPTGALVHFGTDEQKNTWLPAIAAGDCLPAIDVTEPGTGGDVLAMRSRGERVDERTYVLNGRKVCVGNSHVATLHLVVVRTGEGSGGLTAFLVEADRPGISCPAHVPFLGLNGFSCGEVALTDCRIPAVNRVGEEGDGLLVAHAASILYGRPNLAALSLGLQQAAWEGVAERVKDERLRVHQTIQQRIGDIHRRLITSRVVLYEAVNRLDNGMACDEELIAAKLEVVKAAETTTREALNVHGAREGLFVDHPAERRFRDAHCIEFPAGTSDFQRYRLSLEALGRRNRPLSERFATPLERAEVPA
jgi:alkylation response protein AidB-like acyl-CoA dehydrogenase